MWVIALGAILKEVVVNIVTAKVLGWFGFGKHKKKKHKK